MRVYRDIYPNLKEASPNRNAPWTICLVLLVSLVVSISVGTFAYSYYSRPGTLFPVRCPERLLTLKLGPRSAEGEVWAYATFWSYSPQDEGQAYTATDQIVKFAPRSLLANLEKTFKPLSLQPFEHLPMSCRKKIPSVVVVPQEYDDLEYLKNTEMEFPEDLGPLASPLFAADLSSEFRFRDHVSDLARSVMDRADRLMKGRNQTYDVCIPIYLSSITPAIEQFLSPDGEIDVRAAQRKTIEEAMADYRRTTKPLFIVMGDHSVVPGIAANDVVSVSKVPDSVALAVISNGHGAIINHGLWPTFGALLARSNVTSHAMNRTIIDAARNASLNWKAAVVY